MILTTSKLNYTQSESYVENLISPTNIFNASILKDKTKYTSQTEIHGLKFFNERTACISDYRKRHWIKKVGNNLLSYATLIVFIARKIMDILARVIVHLRTFATINEDGLSKKKLVVCIHGLGNNETEFQQLVKAMEKKDLSDTQLLIPAVSRKGFVPLDDAVSPILEQIQTWAHAGGEDKELVLIGVSNGSRISRAIEAELTKNRSSGNIKKIQLVSVVGAWNGSGLGNFGQKTKLSYLAPKCIREEMPTNSERVQRLERDWKMGHTSSPHIKRKYTLIASPHDLIVPSFDTTLPDVGLHSARYAILPGHGHCSVADYASRAIADLICT